MGDNSPGATISKLGPNAGWRFWLAIVLTGLGTGASAAALTLLLQAVQYFMWPGNAATLLDAAAQATPWRHILVLLAAGLVTGAGQIVLVRLTSQQQHRHHRSDLVFRRAVARIADIRQRGVVRRSGRNGRFARPRRRTQAGRRGHRQCPVGSNRPVRRTAPAAGSMRCRSRHGCGLRRTSGRRAVCAGGPARNAGFAAGIASTFDLGHCNGNRICGAARLRRPMSFHTSIVRRLIWRWRCLSDRSPVSCRLGLCERSRGPIETGRSSGGG